MKLREELMRHIGLRDALREAYPGEEDAALADTLEGLSELPEAIAAVINSALIREAMAAGIALRIKELQSRKTRLEVGAEKLRDAALYVMGEAGLNRVDDPGFTISVGKSQPAVVITDEERLPKDCFRIKYEINRAYIRDQLLTGVEVDGAELSNPKLHLTVRVT